MHDVLNKFIQAFIPLFVAIDPIGLAAIFVAMSIHATPERKKKIAFQATVTGGGVALLFLFLGATIFAMLDITQKDFLIAGGVILFILAAKDIIQSSSEDPTKLAEDFGVVPLGMPLIAGPATIATLLLLSQTQGMPVTLAALVVNLVLVILAFRFSEKLASLLGANGLRAVSKIIALLLAAIAVSMIRKGF